MPTAAPNLLPWTCASLVCGGALVGFFFQFNRRSRWTDRNFRGLAIPTSVGVAFGATVAALVPQSFTWLCVSGCGPDSSLRERFHIPLIYVSSVTTFTVLGMLDDRFGSHDIRGLRGHFGALSRGKLTTGAVKALGGALTAVVGAGFLRVFAFSSYGSVAPSFAIAHLVVDTLLIALSANAINLLDRRPARALKGYALLLLLACLVGSRDHYWLLIPINMAAVVYAPLDFRCRAMMGDAGSNTLGAALGMFLALDLTLPIKVVAAAALLALNFGSERYSYSKWMEANRALRWLDRLGVGE